MRYAQPFGTPDNSSYINGNPATGTAGSIPPAEAFENPQRELVNLIVKGGGLTPSAADVEQIAKAVQAGKVSYGVDAGGSDALVVTLDPVPNAYTNGMRVWIRKTGTANTTATPTINVNGLGPKTIIKRNTAAVAIGDLAANSLHEYVYDGVAFRVMSFLASDAAAIAGQYGGMPNNVAVFTASGFWLVPARVTRCYVRLWAGGGSGGGHSGGNGHGGSGGGGGGFAEKMCTVTPGVNMQITVGAGGAAVTGALSGNIGGQTKFGEPPIFYANGGIGGNYGSTGNYQSATGTIGAVVSNSGAVGTFGDVNLYGARGEMGGVAWTSNVFGIGGGGGGSPNGGGGGPGTTSGGEVGTTPGGGGGGGGGGTAANTSSGAGAGGMVIIQWNDPPPA